MFHCDLFCEGRGFVLRSQMGKIMKTMILDHISDVSIFYNLRSLQNHLKLKDLI